MVGTRLVRSCERISPHGCPIAAIPRPGKVEQRLGFRCEGSSPVQIVLGERGENGPPRLRDLRSPQTGTGTAARLDAATAKNESRR